MKFPKLIIGLSAMTFLTGCSFLPISQKISESKFQDQLDNMETHYYSQATVSYNYNMTGTGLLEDYGDKSTGEIIYKFDYSVKSWTYTSKDSKAEDFLILLYSLKGSKITTTTYDEDYPEIIITTTYYKNPLKFTVKRKGNFLQSGVTFNINETTSYTLNKYGYCTKVSFKADDSVHGTLSSGITMDGTQKGTETISIAYK